MGQKGKKSPKPSSTGGWGEYVSLCDEELDVSTAEGYTSPAFYGLGFGENVARGYREALEKLLGKEESSSDKDISK
jgi:hypothetical protein